MSASVASVMKHWKRSPSMSVKGELGAGMGVLTTADHPGARRPGRRVEQMGDFGALRPLALLALEAPVRQGLHELMGVRCGVGPKKHPLATNGIRGLGPHRPLRQGNVRHGFRLGCQGLHPRGYPIGPLKRFWTLETQRIILATALMRQLRKRTNAQRLGLIYLQNRRSTTELRPQAFLRLDSPKQAKMSSGSSPCFCREPHSARRAYKCARSRGDVALSRGQREASQSGGASQRTTPWRRPRLPRAVLPSAPSRAPPRGSVGDMGPKNLGPLMDGVHFLQCGHLYGGCASYLGSPSGTPFY
jgi:hypothetical protein